MFGTELVQLCLILKVHIEAPKFFKRIWKKILVHTLACNKRSKKFINSISTKNSDSCIVASIPWPWHFPKNLIVARHCREDVRYHKARALAIFSQMIRTRLMCNPINAWRSFNTDIYSYDIVYRAQTTWWNFFY